MTTFYIKMKIRAGGGSFRAGGGSFMAAGCSPLLFLFMGNTMKVTNSQLDTTNENQEVSPFPAGDPKAHLNTRAQRHSKHKTRQKNTKYPQKKYRLGTVSKIYYWRA